MTPHSAAAVCELRFLSIQDFINWLDRYGFGRSPVVERDGGKLAGVVTKGDIVKGLLHKLDIEFDEEQEERRRVQVPMRPAPQRRADFEQAEMGYSEELAVEEAGRCLRCDLEAYEE